MVDRFRIINEDSTFLGTNYACEFLEFQRSVAIRNYTFVTAYCVNEIVSIKMDHFTIPSLPTVDTKDCDQDGSHFTVQYMVLAGVSVVIGLIYCLLGYKLFKFILFATGFLVTFFATYVMCVLYMTEKIEGNAEKYRHQIFLALSLGAGIIGGILTLCLYYLGIFILGASLGWFAGMAILPVFKAHFIYIANHLWLPYCLCSGLAILMGLLMLIVEKLFIILATSFIGSLMVIYGLDYFVETGRILGYTVMLLQGVHVELPSCWYTWLLLSFIPVFFFVGVIVQYTKTSKGSDHRLASGRVLVIEQDQQMLVINHDESQQPLLSEYA